ncbi:hypothetical protein AX769_22515 (plasmid) [Frondihabitans sp. PAMC 28766]|uniref:SCO6880 family protein n=1 Tax=Frondihabitans sp. PAMC 28766 TaxID=1795630 RepID=UPI00078CFB72|nr:SCO6880 family protein [Frondihabitans sp. PAMC 28766]AMM22908.1 hypothetical protein AX769_22515 [Frondihabitans sp. PAMC 28766]
MSNSDTAGKRIKFGNWLPTTKPTLGGVPWLGWGVLLGGILLLVGLLVFGHPLAGIGFFFLAAVVVALFQVRWGDRQAGRTIAARIGDRWGHSSRHAAGSTIYKTGLFTALPNEALTALPGALADMSEISGEDGAGEEYVLLHHRKNSPRPTLAATLLCSPDGTQLQPQESIDSQVVSYGGWIAGLSKDSAIEGAVVVVDSTLASTEPLVEKIASEVSSSAPQVAQDALREAADALPARYSSVEVFATVVWSQKELADSLEDAAAEVAAKLPDHRAKLAASGAGQPVVATSEDLARVVRVAYRPDREREFGSDDLAGQTFRMKVTEAGPDVFTDDDRRVCFHDGVASMTVMMTVPPQAHITESTLEELFAPQDRFLRKRVAIFYRPLTPAQAIKRATELRRNAGVSATAKAQPSMFDRHQEALAEKAEGELVTGASMTRFAIMVTVTFEASKRGLRDATQKLKSTLEGTGISYRFVETDTSAAFHATLPLGLLPWAYQTPAQSLTEGSI